MQHLQALGEHGGTAFSQIETALVEHGEMGDEGRRRLAFPLSQHFHLRDKLLIGELTNKGEDVCVHGLCKARGFCSP